MAHYAKVLNGEVVDVIVADSDFINSFVDTSPGEWIQTSYNTFGGQHLDGGTPLRYNYASVGFKYDADADAFYAPQPYDSWTLNTTTYIWEAPVAYPDGTDSYVWNEDTQAWETPDD